MIRSGPSCAVFIDLMALVCMRSKVNHLLWVHYRPGWFLGNYISPLKSDMAHDLALRSANISLLINNNISLVATMNG